MELVLVIMKSTANLSLAKTFFKNCADSVQLNVYMFQDFNN